MGRTLLAGLLVLLVSTAGCMGVQREPPPLLPAQERALPGSWQQENRTGSVGTGADLLVDQVGGTGEPVTVPNGTVTLTLRLSSLDGELDVCIDRPGKPNGTVADRDRCDERISTENGQARWTANSPTSGNWMFHLSPSTPTQGPVEYVLVLELYVLEGEPAQPP